MKKSNVIDMVILFMVVLMALFTPLCIKRWHYENYMKIEDAKSYISGEGGIEITMSDGSKVFLEIPEK